MDKTIVGEFCALGLIACIGSLALGHLAYADSLLGDGINLKIKGNLASGTLVLSGKYYNAPNLTISTKAGQIQLSGYAERTGLVYLMTTGILTKGTEYKFNGMLQNNGKATPVSFIASLIQDVKTQPNTVSNQPTVTTSNQPTGTTSKQPGTTSKQPSITKQAPTLPMLMLSAQSNLVYVGHFYLLAVKIFDPKANPAKSFDQFNGGISGVNVNVIILDQNNQPLGKLSGRTDNKGLYQDQMFISYSLPQKQEMKVVVNATKQGYTSQQTTLSFELTHPRRD